MAIISINQLAEFSKATEKGKTRIIKQQVTPNPILIPWYQLAKARIKKCISNNWDLDPVYSGIEILQGRSQFENNRQQNDQKVSLEALGRFLKMPKPQILQSIDWKSFTPNTKSLVLGNLEIIVAPDVVFRTEIDNQKYVGGFKVHVCKSKAFDLKQSSIVATILWKYLAREIAKEGEIVLPSLCFCYDVFSDRMVPSHEDTVSSFENIHVWGQEVIQIWDSLKQTG